MFDFVNEPFHATGFINEIGKDRSTDLTVSIILDVLCDFTLSICTQYSIPTKEFENYRHYWDPNEKCGKHEIMIYLPIIMGSQLCWYLNPS